MHILKIISEGFLNGDYIWDELFEVGQGFSKRVYYLGVNLHKTLSDVYVAQAATITQNCQIMSQHHQAQRK